MNERGSRECAMLYGVGHGLFAATRFHIRQLNRC